MNVVLEKIHNQHRVSLRKPLMSDADYLAKYWAGPNSDHLRPYIDISKLGTYDVTLANTKEGFSRLSVDGPWNSLIGTINEVPAGIVLINSIKSGEEASVHVHIWDPDHRRTGLASLLAHDALKYFLESFSLKRLIFNVNIENTPVLNLLDALGLKPASIEFGKAAPISLEGEYAHFLITLKDIENFCLCHREKMNIEILRKEPVE